MRPLEAEITFISLILSRPDQRPEIMHELELTTTKLLRKKEKKLLLLVIILILLIIIIINPM